MPVDSENFTLWHGLLLAEAAAVMIALLMPITPSKTGSDWSLAQLFISDPTYLQEVFVYFVFTNVVLLLLGAVVLIWLKMKGN